MKISEIQQTIFAETGIKTSVKKGVGSMRGYYVFTPMFQGGVYPKFPVEWCRAFRDRFPRSDSSPMFSTVDRIEIFHGVEVDESVKFKRESKPKTRDEMSVRTWGSENSQIRLDKTAARYAKKRRGPSGDNMVKYW
jgi:hypothetical protein